jgi:NCAIR mutase (PurE)-related protein
MNERHLHELLDLFSQGRLHRDELASRLLTITGRQPPSACLDHYRHLRTGMPEAVFGQGKTESQLMEILSVQLERNQVVMATRVDPDKAAGVLRKLPGLTYNQEAAMLIGNEQHIPKYPDIAPVVLACAGTSDIPIAEEARLTLHCLGCSATTLYDVGVAGIHRILAHQDTLGAAGAVIVVAGMEGALPSVVAGLTSAPVIGVPTSVGYGTGTGGFAALLGMLNSCAPGLAVVNIDNGFGAACMAAAILRPRSVQQRDASTQK